MNLKQLGAEVVLIVFSVFTLYAVYQHGYIGLFQQALTNTASVQVFLDLTIALSIVMLWIWQDAENQGIAPLPYILLTFTLGSIGPLLYLIRRLGKDTPLFSRSHAPQL